MSKKDGEKTGDDEFVNADNKLVGRPKRTLFISLWDLAVYPSMRVKISIKNDYLVNLLEQEKFCVVMPLLGGDKKELGKVGFLAAVGRVARGKDGNASLVETLIIERALVTDLSPRAGPSAKEKILDCEWTGIKDPEIAADVWAGEDFQDRLLQMKECFLDACFFMRILEVNTVRKNTKLHGSEVGPEKKRHHQEFYDSIALHEKMVLNIGRRDFGFIVDRAAEWLSEFLDTTIGLNKLIGAECIDYIDTLMFNVEASWRILALAMLSIFLRERMEDFLSGFEEGTEMTRRGNYDVPKGKFPPNVEKAIKELAKRADPNSSDGQVVITYIEWLESLPWTKTTEDEKDFNKVREALEADHYGLEQPKQKVMKFIAIRKTKSDAKAPILCFVGPPGVGKTSLGESIARSMGRKFISLSLGGLKDEAELRGHRRTYIGSMPGLIIQRLREVGVKNPVFMLDEIDKLGEHGKDIPENALMEILDPKQNHAFRDHYIQEPFDLSEVFFITTANTTETIHEAVLNRTEVIQLSAYTDEEKVEIAYRHILPKCLLEVGIEGKNLKDKNLPVFTVDFSREAMEKIVGEYTYDAGMRDAERAIKDILGEILKKVHENKFGELESGAEENGELVIKITAENLKNYLGKKKSYLWPMDPKELGELKPGVALVLMVNSRGQGSIGPVEVSSRKDDRFDKKFTGSLRDVLKESGDVAIDRLFHDGGVLEGISHKRHFHVNLPDGATPKDGPSAGVAILEAIYSERIGVPVKPYFAATGEVTLKLGDFPVGAIVTKLLAAKKAGIKEVAIPYLNAQDLEGLKLEDIKIFMPEDRNGKTWQEISREPKDYFAIYCVESPDDVLALAFPDHYPPAPEMLAKLKNGNGDGNGGNAEKKQ